MAKSKREVIYPEKQVILCTARDDVIYDPSPEGLGSGPLSAEQMKALFGWEVEGENPESGIFEDDYFCLDGEGRKVRCHNNDHNRPFKEAHARKLAQDMLNHHWRMNGETIIIGCTGLVLSAQHRGMGLIYAEQERTGKNAAYWKSKGWTGPVTIDTIVVLGISEDSETTRTLDNVLARTFADTLFADGSFGNRSKSDRTKLCKMTDYCIRMLWHRTGADRNPFALNKTHSEFQDFVDRHESLKKCVQLIFAENNVKSNPIGQYLTPGTAAALMYLMAASQSDGVKYRPTNYPLEIRGENKSAPSEKKINFKAEVPIGKCRLGYDKGQKVTVWDLAEAFWKSLAAEGDPDTGAVRSALNDLKDPHLGRIVGKRLEVTAILAKAWACLLEGREITESDLKLEYLPPNSSGVTPLADFPDFGGIDLGEPSQERPETPTEEEVENTKAKIREEKVKPRTPDARPAPTMSVKERLTKLWEDNPGRTLLFSGADGSRYTAYGSDAHEVSKALNGAKLKKNPSGIEFLPFDSQGLLGVISALQSKGMRISLVVEQGDDAVVTPWENSVLNPSRVKAEDDEEEILSDELEGVEEGEEQEEEAPLPVKNKYPKGKRQSQDPEVIAKGTRG